MSAIGIKIRKLREIKGYKQEYMAEKLGVTQQYYSKLESEKTDVPFSKIEQLAEIFEIKPEELIAFDEKTIFNIYSPQNFGYTHSTFHINFPQELKQLYEDKIRLLEEKIIYLTQLNHKN